ncbi:MAG: TRAP transporter large permease subunit [Myxococcota bacterium]|nr:TRAP transporter large permease subunit [Myxococcota bacterium]
MKDASTSHAKLTALLIVAAVVILISVLAANNAQMVNAQLQKVGEEIWPGYNTKGLNSIKPACDLKALSDNYNAARRATGGSQVAEDDDLLDDVADDKASRADRPAHAPEDDDLLDDIVEKKMAPAPVASPADGDDLLDDVVAEPNRLKVEDDDDLLDDVVAAPEKGTKGTDDDDLLDDVADGPSEQRAKVKKVNPALAKAWKNAYDVCASKHAAYAKAQRPESAGEGSFRWIQGQANRLKTLGDNLIKPFLVLLFLVCTVVATLRRHHIALRPPAASLDDRVCETAQLVANLLLAHSFYSYRAIGLANKATEQETLINTLWCVGFIGLAVANLANLIRGARHLSAGGRIPRALLSVPLYALMCLISGTYFLFAEGHSSGLATYLSKLNQNALLYLNVGLYVWVGMMLKGTRIAGLCFDVVRPWRFPPEILAFVVVVGAALPTAYSGASGIFVIAVGAVIFEELIRAGARPQLALAATAMSGSMGVVLRPCLLVVIVASLNQEVTTDQLYTWGVRVFLLSAILFLIVALFNRQPADKMAPVKEGISGMFVAFGPLFPYVALFTAIILFYAFALDAHLDENSAPFILPAMLMAALCFESIRARRTRVAESEPAVPRGFGRRLSLATDETAGHIGALLALMGLSVCVGGIIERAEIMELVPHSFGSVWLTMGLLVVILVIIGMTMDPYGAVILVSATIAAVAYRNGIDPVHFWMVVLVAFELGYLTPPVALNHLLTRQVVGEEAFAMPDENLAKGFYARNERLLLPIIVMGVALILVAFVPLAIGYG